MDATVTRLVLHLGAHKTGTSLIQRFLRHTDDYTSRHGISYVNRFTTDDLIGDGSTLLRSPDLLRDHLHDLRRTSPDNVIVLSHEDTLGRPFLRGEQRVYPQARACATCLREAVDGFDVRVVYYIRPLADFVESYYIQTVHQGSTRSFTEWISALDHEHWRWGSVVDELDQTFGANRVRLGDFAEIWAGQQEFLRDFAQRAGLPDPSAYPYTQVHNPSVSARGLDIALAVNPLLRAEYRERYHMRMFLQRNFSNQQFPRARPMPPEIRERIGAGDYESLSSRARASLQPEATGA